jgi:catechol 2,3-dioxygenase-like lactoylglutathione lyase family enzyme
MKLNHFAIASNSEEDSNSFFQRLLGFQKTRDFTVPAKLMDKFFEENMDQRIIRYEKGDIAAEVFITDDNNSRTDTFTHVCLEVENRDEIVSKGRELNFKVIQVPRENSEGYYLFIQDRFGNIYEIK